MKKIILFLLIVIISLFINAPLSVSAYTVGNCPVCGTTLTEVDFYGGGGPSCEYGGESWYRCSCNGMLIVEFPPLGHDYVPCEEIPPTCTESGYTGGVRCDNCGDEIEPQTIIPPTGHNFEFWYYIPPGCYWEGEEYYRCEYCNSDEPSKIIPPTGHHYTRVEPLTCNEFSCEDCGDTKTVGDIDEEAGLNIKDVTCVQKILAEIIEPSKYNYLADANGDGEVTIKDATYLQLFIAQLIDTFPQN